MSMTARPTDAQFSAIEQQAILQWKELQVTAAENDDDQRTLTDTLGSQNVQHSGNPSRRTTRALNEMPSTSSRSSKKPILRLDNPLTIEEKLLKMEEPTLCWCKKEAATFDTLEFGVIYECHNLQEFRTSKISAANESSFDDVASIASDITDKRKDDISRSSSSSSPANGSSTNSDQVFPSKPEGSKKVVRSPAILDKIRGKGRAQPSNICGFHVHKRVWDQLRNQLQAGNDLDSNHVELNICPAFNLTFCASFRLQNSFPKRSPPVPKCFCNFPVKMLLSTSGLHKNRVIFTCPNFDVDNARPKCSWALIAEEVPFIPSIICTHALLQKSTGPVESSAASLEATPSQSQKSVAKDNPVSSSLTALKDLSDDIVSPKGSASSSIVSDAIATTSHTDPRPNTSGSSVDRHGIRWTKDRQILGASSNANTPIVADNGADSMAGPSFSSYSAEANDEYPPHQDGYTEKDVGHTSDRALQTASDHEYGMYEQSSPQTHSSEDLFRQHQYALRKAILRNKSDHQISEWMTGLNLPNQLTASQQSAPPIRRSMSNGSRSGVNNGDMYNDNESYQPYRASVSTSYDPNSAYSIQMMQDHTSGENHTFPTTGKSSSNMVPPSVYKTLMIPKRASDNPYSKASLLNTLNISEPSEIDVSQPQHKRTYPEYNTPKSPGPSRSKEHVMSSPTTPSTSKQNVSPATLNTVDNDMESNGGTRNQVMKQLDVLEANFHKSISSLFLNQKKQILQIQEQMMVDMEAIQYPMYEYVAKLERTQRSLQLENELFKREKLHAEESHDKMQQVHAEEMDLRRHCQKRTANLEILVTEILQQNERLQQEIEEKNEVAKLSDFKCRVCWHNTITHATIPCYHLYCEACADKVKECAMCRKAKDGIQRIYLG
ncbi:hypothetical protein K450DRAFT_230114 [Umbelopsis ramanniana AG]|uniref:RING-type domain-containing protein n=1 Tax=Umbelopsis ramanniana AG TaxID=1314678 RepID=A0AAD5HH96_UMBRA|nr:uncharacterized protein K450DRAFT_230114 [Umbelopsis ramanniana AG]KAI8581958.1 hypothetical protein K450DRAFT_230114 [Umbelopsis ramanniana AG]